MFARRGQRIRDGSLRGGQIPAALSAKGSRGTIVIDSGDESDEGPKPVTVASPIPAPVAATVPRASPLPSAMSVPVHATALSSMFAEETARVAATRDREEIGSMEDSDLPAVSGFFPLFKPAKSLPVGASVSTRRDAALAPTSVLKQTNGQEIKTKVVAQATPSRAPPVALPSPQATESQVFGNLPKPPPKLPPAAGAPATLTVLSSAGARRHLASSVPQAASAVVLAAPAPASSRPRRPAFVVAEMNIHAQAVADARASMTPAATAAATAVSFTASHGLMTAAPCSASSLLASISAASSLGVALQHRDARFEMYELEVFRLVPLLKKVPKESEWYQLLLPTPEVLRTDNLSPLGARERLMDIPKCPTVSGIDFFFTLPVFVSSSVQLGLRKCCMTPCRG